ncbi:hypothetical protein EW145_g970 [Phellinidium pouzarii]|uniref:PB1 domain-containing protein n=1 Tax=Phellinidium pouzarii TaxID=167371 RepID=A0A4S4LGY6_9AGAM|nr:hypothetical protein EW145_g970 [Phellinidium pouzarii]
MTSTYLKLTRPGRETRRISFPTQPSWHALETRIASLFDIPHGNVAASYEDNDGDIITLSSHEELYEYFANYHVIYHRQGEPIRFNVIDTRETRRPAREGVSSNFVEEISINEEAEGEVPTLGPTMVFEVGDTDWQHLPRMPNIFGMHDGEDQPEFEQAHAYVEVVDSDAVSSKQGSEPAHSVHASPRPGSHESRRRDTGKNRAISDAKSTSTTSISENQSPAKQAVHIYNVSDAGGSPRIAPMRVGSEHFSQQRYLAFGSGASDHNRNRDSDHTGSIGPESTSGGRTPQTTPRQAPTLDLETPPPVLRQLQPASEASASSDESAAYPSRPAFSRDVASLIDGLTEAFASHPELSEGMRNIVRNAVEGRYWETERDRVASAAEAVRAAAEDTSGRISRAARDIAYSERDAVKRIAEALGGVFRVIGQLSSSRNDEVNSTSSRIGDHLPPAGGPPRAPEPSPRDPGLPSHGSPHPHRPPGDWHTFGGPPPPPLHGDPFDRYRAAPPFSSRFPYHRHHRHPQARPDHLVDPENPFAHPPAPPPPGTGHFEGFPVPPHQGPSPRNYEQMMHDPRGTWATGSYAPVYYGGSSREPYGIVERPSIHESKAQLEAAKAVYKAEKERFRQEKEERRRMRHEFAERRAEEGRAARIDGTIREETIIARIPLPGSSTGPSEQPYAEIYSVPPQPASAEYTTPAAQVQYAPSVSLPRSQAASTHTASVAPPPPPSPSSAPVMSHAPIIPLQHEQAVPAPFAPLPWPMPTRTGASRRAGLSRLQDRIIARLFEMGITASSQPKMMDIVNEHANRVNIDEEEALRGVIEALEINGSPSPRPSASHLPH